MCVYDYVWWPRKYLKDRKNSSCRVLIRANGRGPRNILVEFEDGYKVITYRFAVRKKKDFDET